VCGGAGPADALPFLLGAQKAGMSTSDYAYIVPFVYVSSSGGWEPWLATSTNKNLTNSDRLNLLNAFKPVLVVSSRYSEPVNARDHIKHLTGETVQVLWRTLRVIVWEIEPKRFFQFWRRLLLIS